MAKQKKKKKQKKERCKYARVSYQRMRKHKFCLCPLMITPLRVNSLMMKTWTRKQAGCTCIKKTDFSVVLFRPHFMLASEEYLMKVHKNQWLLNLLFPPDIPCGATNQGTHHGV